MWFHLDSMTWAISSEYCKRWKHSSKKVARYPEFSRSTNLDLVKELTIMAVVFKEIAQQQMERYSSRRLHSNRWKDILVLSSMKTYENIFFDCLVFYTYSGQFQILSFKANILPTCACFGLKDTTIRKADRFHCHCSTDRIMDTNTGNNSRKSVWLVRLKQQFVSTSKAGAALFNQAWIHGTNVTNV